MDSVVTINDMRRLEQAAVDSGAVTYDTLMENAGAAVVSVIRERYVGTSTAVLVLCGNGNNGGDGYVIARLLKEQYPEMTVRCLRVCGAAATALAASKEQLVDDIVDLEESGIYDELALYPYSVVVDAVYGIGFHGELPVHIRRLFDALSSYSLPVVAVDIPSGIHADSGACDASVLDAAVTVTFTATKPAMLMPEISPTMGDIVVADVGIDDALVKECITPLTVLNREDVHAMLPDRPQNGHKGTFGRLLTVCGSYGMAGAAMLSGKAALRMGVGLLHMALPRSVYPIVAGQLWEAVYHPLEESSSGTFCAASMKTLEGLLGGKNALLIGCGLSCCDETAQVVKGLLENVTVPTVLDADGLNVFSSHIVDLKAVNAPLVITPHSAEAARLLDQSVEQVERDRVAAVKRLASESGAIAVLKGHRTLIATADGDVFMNTTGNAGMATGGSGDVLSGMIASLLAQGVPALQAAIIGVYLHGEAGDLAANTHSPTAMLPTDMIEELCHLLS